MSHHEQDPRIKIAKRVAQELREGDIVNLGVGIPTLIPDYLGKKQVYLQSENGLLGMGPTPPEEKIDMDLISASKKPVSMLPGASLFDSADAFAMIRGGHVDVAVLGALQVDQSGEIANWAVPGQRILGVGGAMDLLAGAKKVIVTLTHQTKNGDPKLVKTLTYPRTGLRKADLIITEKAVFQVADGQLILVEKDPELTLGQLRSITDAHFEIAADLSVSFK
ncbi:3-oxoacid CoA-transferase B subunit [Caldalkalibacillus uzonensis]|uniref:3-oxoacid CoA-transferase B subunit n=1 Tax=Caldalkalibacillus uzonensis TaxID=353224 RepID=A0ABU0CWG1_9BACI|nr:3-oxoacid CoA-transferase subunit B [Caldalkalibacillus uzonensis]MDQ0340746.1 3-oxoacid CoA-transferase B subunit [Caldalkalibacillus uzonensis]